METYGERIVKPYLQAVEFLIRVLLDKEVIRSVDYVEEQLLLIKRKGFLSDILVYVVDAYVLGEGATLEIIKDNPEINAILVLSKWNQYTYDAKKYALSKKIGLFTFDEFMGAVYYNGTKFINYKPPKRTE